MNDVKKKTTIKPKSLPSKTRGSGRDYTKFRFQDHIYGKGQLVWAVINAYVKQHVKITYGELKKVFPKELQGNFEVIEKHVMLKKTVTLVTNIRC